MVGRDTLLASFDIALRRIQQAKSQKSMLPTGLRGVGKTVLLNRFVENARRLGYAVAQMEASSSESFLADLAAEMRTVLYELSAKAKLRGAFSRALGVLKSFSLTLDGSDLSLKLGIDAEQGVGGLRYFERRSHGALRGGRRSRSRRTAGRPHRDRRAAIPERRAACGDHHGDPSRHATCASASGLGDGLPQLPALAGNAKSYAERLFDYPKIGALSNSEAFQAIRAPAHNEGVEFQEDALAQLFRITEGYPYFIQEWAYTVWNLAPRSPITLSDVREAEPEVLARLDESFFRVRYDRLTPSEKNYLRAMAQLGPGPHRSGDIASLLGVKVESASPLRSNLIRKGMIYSPQHGDTAFTVPLFDAFMRRSIPDTTFSA